MCCIESMKVTTCIARSEKPTQSPVHAITKGVYVQKKPSDFFDIIWFSYGNRPNYSTSTDGFMAFAVFTKNKLLFFSSNKTKTNICCPPQA